VTGVFLTDGNYRQARSSTRLTQADRLSCALAAALPYRARRSSDTRRVSQRRSPLAMGGLPLGFLASIGWIMYQQIVLDKAPVRVFNVPTLKEVAMETKTFTAPKDFTDKFPRYVYRDGKGKESVQWREAALDMANDRAKLVEALRDTLTVIEAKMSRNEGLTLAEIGFRDDTEALLRELGEV
jgi:hypothetical protein